MSIGGIGQAPSVGTIAAAQIAATRAATQAVGAAAAKAPVDAGPSAFFDMTAWTGPAEASVTTGAAAAKAGLPELSASVLSAILR